MTAWDKVLDRIRRATEDRGISGYWFRGHAEGSWKLLPGLARVPEDAYSYLAEPTLRQLEQNLYFDFVLAGGDLIPRTNDPWDQVFLMQHHGLPTRLLDWSESFAIALFFALRGTLRQPCVWVLDPFSLNAKTLGAEEVLDVPDLKASYCDYFLEQSTPFTADAIALRPPRHVRRIGQQLSAFTLHGKLDRPLTECFLRQFGRFRYPLRRSLARVSSSN